jgi:hypothetical protein
MAGSADVLLGMQSLWLWVVPGQATLASAMTATDVVIAATPTTVFANASQTHPARVKIDTEIIYVTGSGASAPCVRGREGTTPAIHASGASLLIRQGVQVLKTADWTPNTDIQDIAIPGDGTVEHVFRMQGLRGTLTANKWPEDVLWIAMGIPIQTTGIPPDMLSLMHPQVGTYPQCEMHVNLVALDGSDMNKTVTKRILIWMAQLQNPFVPGTAGNNTLQGTPINWSANPTTVDINGLPIPGATQAIHYSVGNVNTAGGMIPMSEFSEPLAA